jgi:hypothetical protein
MTPFSYSFQLGEGLNPYLLKGIETVVGTQNAPSLKIDNLGFLTALKSQNQTLQINRPGGNGAVEFVQVKYLQRAVEGQVSTQQTCNTLVNQNAYQESTVALNNFAQYSLFIPDQLIQEYTSDCNMMPNLPGGIPPTAAMKEMLYEIYAGSNAILRVLDGQLLNAVSVGVNAATGSATPKQINFTVDTNDLPLTDGMTELLYETQIINEFASGKVQIVGSGLVGRFFKQQIAKGLAQNGLNTTIEAMEAKMYFDTKLPTIFNYSGTGNDFLAFSPDDLQIVEFSQYTGAYGGRKGISDFGSFVLPIQMTASDIVPVQFDYQLRYLDCPEAVAQMNNYYGQSITASRGWQMIISKYVGLFQPPTNTYKASDPLYGTNGCIQYYATNV